MEALLDDESASTTPNRDGVARWTSTTGFRALLVVSIVSAAAPFVCALLARFRVPQVVVLIVGGVLIGPEVAGLAKPDSIELVANVGLGFLFLLAGYELELDHFRERSGRLAMVGWLISAVVSIAVTGAARSGRLRARLRPGGTGADHDRARGHCCRSCGTTTCWTGRWGG